jgi:hypothetical protein
MSSLLLNAFGFDYLCVPHGMHHFFFLLRAQDRSVRSDLKKIRSMCAQEHARIIGIAANSNIVSVIASQGGMASFPTGMTPL